MDSNVHLEFPRVAIVGVGLIGGAIGKALLSRKKTESVIGIGRNEQRLQRALDLNAVTEFTTDFDAGVVEADVVVVCTPVNRIAEFSVRAAKITKPTALITDAGSTKSEIVAAVHNQIGDSPNKFIGSHPMAGGEKTGVDNSDPDLFVDQNVIITPDARSDSQLTKKCELFWQTMGANTKIMSPDLHDQTVAEISHVPHVMASILAASTDSAAVEFASSGWRDTTRVASGDVEMWRHILDQNRIHILKSLDNLRRQFDAFHQALESQDDETIVQILQQGKQKRDVVAG